MADIGVEIVDGPGTYVDSREPDASHAGLPFVPMLKDTTVMLLGLAPSNAAIPSAAFVTQPWPLSMCARDDFDGTVTLLVYPIAKPWGTQATWTDTPDLRDVTPASFTGPISAGDVVTIDVQDFVADMIGGAETYGWAVVRDDTGTAGTLYGLTSTLTSGALQPSLQGDWGVSPVEPTALVPAGGRIVATNKPVMEASFGSVPILALQWQIAATASGFTKSGGLDSGASAFFDSGTIATTEPKVVTADLVGFTGLPAEGTTRWWTLRVKDSSGAWSLYADPADVGGWAALPVVTATSPAFGVTFDVNPPRTWSATGTQAAWQVVTSSTSSPVAVLDDSGRVNGTATAYTANPATGLAGTGQSGVLLRDGAPVVDEIRVWDDKDREATLGYPVYGSTLNSYGFAPNGTVAPPDDVAILQIGASPWPKFRFSTEQDFEYAIFSWGTFPGNAQHFARHKRENLTKIVSEEATFYELIYWGAQPWQPGYVGGVKLVVGGQASHAEYGSLASLEVSGVWVGDADPTSPTYGVQGWFSGRGSNFSRTDQVGILNAYGAQFPMVQWNTEGPIVASFAGVIKDGYGKQASDWETALRRLAGNGRIVQIAHTNTSWPAFIYNYHSDPLSGVWSPFMKSTSFEAVQVGPASFADDPVNPGDPVIVTYDYEALVSGAAPTEGAPILRADTGDTGSPGITDRDGVPTHTADAAVHGDFGADTGWRA